MDQSSARIRLTISVTPEVHATYLRLSKAANSSIGRAMGDWLGDTQDAAIYSASMLEQARQAPKDAIRQLNAVTASLVAQSEALSERIMEKASSQGGARGPEGARAARSAPLSPPVSNTGGKGPAKGTRKAA